MKKLLLPIIVASIMATSLYGQSPRDCVAGLGLEVLTGEVPAYYSPGHRDHAEQVVREIQAFSTTIADSLELRIEGTAVALLTAADWGRLLGCCRACPPVGLPFASLDMIVLETPARDGVLHRLYMDAIEKATAQNVSRLAQSAWVLDESLEDAVAWISSNVWAHEWGHIVTGAFVGGRVEPGRFYHWLSETLANYLWYAEIKSQSPERAFLFESFARVIKEGCADWAPAGLPDLQLLEHFENNYVRMVSNDPWRYGWFDAWFALRAIDIFESSGYRFLRDVNPVVPWPAGAGPLTHEKIVEQLERHTPGFKVWLPNEEIKGSIANRLKLDQNYPNPFSTATTIRFSVPSSGPATLTVHDLLGRKVERLVEGVIAPGKHVIGLNGRSLPSGIYIYTLEVEGARLSRVMQVLK